MKSEVEEQIKIFLDKQETVLLSYLFGSVARQSEGKLSDVDLAIYLDKTLNLKERFNSELRLRSGIGDILETDKIDLVVMNDAPLSLNFEIIKANHPIFIRDQDVKVDFEHYIISHYLDRQFYDQRWADELIKKTANRNK